MAIDYEKLIAKTPPGDWLTGPELEAAWKVNPVIRKARAKVLVTRGFLIRRGKTAMTQYKLASKGSKKEPKTKAKTKPDTTLDALIKAATIVGTDNEILRNKLVRIRAILDEV